MYLYINLTPRLIKNTAQDPTGSNQLAKYFKPSVHHIFVGVGALFAVVFAFHSSPSQASIITNPTVNGINSQRIALLTPNYAVEIPRAIGGADDIPVDNRLALLSPQVSVASGTSSLKNVEVDASGIITYVIQEGDTLSAIAEDFDVSINTIKWENDLGKTIKPGQELQILPITGVRHTITKGDTFGSIAKKYDVEIEDITIYNDIDAAKLTPGKKIIIPNGVLHIAKSSVSSSSSKGSSSVSTSRSSDGYYIRPTSGPTTSSFGPRKGSYHYGIDYGAPTGTTIVATASGTVVKTSCGSGYGKCMVIQHNNGTQSLYAHASALYVNVGSKVSQGQKIAAVGSTGRSSGPHLHFEIIESNGKKRNTNFLK